MDHRECCRDICAGTNQHFIARADACCRDRDMQRSATAAHRDAIFASTISSELFFEARYRFSKRTGDLTAPERCNDRFYFFFADYRIENFDHQLLLTSTLILSFSAPRKGPCLTLMHCMSSITRTAWVP